MITTGKKDLFANYASYFLRLASNIILLPFILGYLNSSEYGLWNIYISLGAFVNLVDVGFGLILTRYATYAFCGAKAINADGLPEMDDKGSTNFQFLLRIFLTAKNIYSKLFFATIGIGFACGTYLYIKYSVIIDARVLVLSWIIYAISCCIQLYYVSYNCIIKGMGKIKESSYYYIIQHLIHISLALLLLRKGMGILGLSLSTLISTLVFRFLNARFLRCFFKKNGISLSSNIEKDNDYKNIYYAVKTNTKGIALVTVTNYITGYGITIICSLFLPLDKIASIGITNQLISLVCTVGSTAFSTYTAKMGNAIISGRKKELIKLFIRTDSWFYFCFFCGIICILLLGPWALALIKSNTVLLGKKFILLFSLSSFFTYNSQRYTNFIMLFNKQPHVKAFFFSSISIVIISFVTLWITRDLLGYVLPSIFVQATYNAWKWPIEAIKCIKSL